MAIGEARISSEVEQEIYTRCAVAAARQMKQGSVVAIAHVRVAAVHINETLEAAHVSCVRSREQRVIETVVVAVHYFLESQRQAARVRYR